MTISNNIDCFRVVTGVKKFKEKLQIIENVEYWI